MQKILFLLLLFMVPSCKNNVDYEQDEPVYQMGDHLGWALKGFNDSNWPKEKSDTGDEVFWVRTKVKLQKITPERLGLQVHSFGAFDVYWDGVLIGKNGVIASSSIAEVPGTESSYYLIPDSLARIGTHQFALRATQAYERKVFRGVNLKLDNYNVLLTEPLIIMSFVNLMAGAFLIAALYFLLLYVHKVKKEYPILIFAIICLMFFVLLILEYIKFYIAIPYTRFYLRLELIGWLTFAIAMLVPLYFSIQFHFPKKIWLLTLHFIALLAVYIINYRHYDLTAFMYSSVMWPTMMIIVLVSLYRREKGATVVCMGLVFSIVVHQYLVYDYGLFLSFTFIVLGMLYLHTLRTRILEEEYESSLLLSSRLKLELIKKNIQPHFLKNTLTSLMDWVEESPKEGSAFIQALAGEFDIMNAIADEALIPIRQEIELCKTHLFVMHFRKEITYIWEDEGIDENEQIPPALIHTLLENGITHSIPLDGSLIYFKLSYVLTEKYKQYAFQTRALNRVKVRASGAGAGFAYVKARLTESYQHKWEFSSEEVADGWLSTIKIYSV